jgi:integrase/recombinase XerC
MRQHPGSRASKHATVCATVREVLTRAGLSSDPAVRPSSLTGYAARTVFDRTGRIEKAAELLGATSLDAAAALIGHHWQAQPPS